MIGDFLINALNQIIGEVFGISLERVIDKRELQRDISAAIKRAEECFAREYRVHDPEIVDVLTIQTRFIDIPSVQEAMKELLTHPFHDTAPSISVLRKSFDDVLPSFTDRPRLDNAIVAFLDCLGREVLYIPQLQQLYILSFQKVSTQNSRTIAMNTTEMAHSIRILQNDFKLLPDALVSSRLALPEITDRPAERLRPWHNLPQRTYSEFIGRRFELQKVIDLLLPRSRHFLVTLDGIGGVGKSSLALEVAYRHLELYDTLPAKERFDAIIWVSAKRSRLTASGIQQRQQTFSTLGDLYREIATVLEAPKILQSDSEQQRGLVEHVLTSQRVLLVVDNLETVDDEELLTFLREIPDPTKCIVTTRHRIDIAFTVRLEGMPHTDAIELINLESTDKTVDLSVDFAKELYQRTGGIPLAIVWSIGLMGLGYEVASVLRRLNSGKSDISRFCFSESTTYIQQNDSYKLLLALSLFESSVSRNLLGEVVEFNEDEFKRDDGLAELLQLSLVNKEQDRFSLLPLTRRFALEELSKHPSVEETLRNKWINVLISLAKPYAEIGWRWHDLTQLSQEGMHLVTLFVWAKQVGRPDILVQIIPALEFCYDMAGQWTDRLAINQMGVEYARLLGNKKILFIMLRNICGILGQQGRYEEAAQAIDEALTVSRETGNIAWECKALVSYSGVMRRHRLFDEAVEYCQQALAVISDLPDKLQREIRASIAYELGKLARDRGDWKSAEAHFIASRDVFGYQEGSTEFDVGRAWGVLSNLGVVTHKLGNLDSAERIYLQCLDHCRKTGSRGSVATLLIRLAELEEQRGNYLTALNYVLEGLEWSKHLNIVHEQAQAEEIFARLVLRTRRSK